MNITLSVDERVAENAREAARKMGKSLNQAVRDYLERLAGEERKQQESEEYIQRCLSGGGGRLNGWKFDREEANARRFNPSVNQVAERPTPWRMWERDPPPRCFIDTNILIYADSDDEPAKQHAAALLIAYVINTNSGVISTQVLNEYANVALRKLKITHERLRQQLHFYQQFEIVSGTPDITEAAVDLHQTRSVSFYDALILASAQIAGCKLLYSEDMNAGEVVGGVKLVNPFG